VEARLAKMSGECCISGTDELEMFTMVPRLRTSSGMNCFTISIGANTFTSNMSFIEEIFASIAGPSRAVNGQIITNDQFSPKLPLRTGSARFGQIISHSEALPVVEAL
jgi:hypothetical protein